MPNVRAGSGGDGLVSWLRAYVRVMVCRVPMIEASAGGFDLARDLRAVI
jgi:hypothetical protein